jgi:hypothetical protein
MITLEELDRARAVIDGHVHRTPSSRRQVSAPGAACGST